MFQVLSGGCLCQAVQYRIDGKILKQTLCHCPSCRLAAGASPVGWLVVEMAHFALTAGIPSRYESSPNVVRTFCATCGTALTWQALNSPKTVDINAVTLDDPTSFTPEREVWVKFRQPWLPALAAVKQFPGGSGNGASS